MNKSFLAKLFVFLGALITFGSLGFMIMFILVNGVPYLTPSLFEFQYTIANVSLMPALITTLYVIGGAY